MTSQFTWAINSTRHQGTYKVIPKVEWTVLLDREFGKPNWSVLYPLNDKGHPVGILTPRLACKLFQDGVYVIKTGEAHPKYVQDHVPEICHKQFKKKQWRKQFFEGMRRVCCRLALGKGFRPNCVAEDVFVHAIISMAHELGWRRIEAHTEGLPESDVDKDYNRLLRLATNDEVTAMIKTISDIVVEAPTAAAKKKTVSTAAIANAKMDVKSWFQCYELSEDHLFDHIVFITGDEDIDEDVDSTTITTANTSSADEWLSSSSALPTPTGGDGGCGASRGEGFHSTPNNLSARGPIKWPSRSFSQESRSSVDKLYPGIGIPRQQQKMKFPPPPPYLSSESGDFEESLQDLHLQDDRKEEDGTGGGDGGGGEDDAERDATINKQIDSYL